MSSELADLLESHLDELLQRWMEAVKRTLPVPHPVPDSELANSLPDYLRQMIQLLRLEPAEARHRVSIKAEVAKAHGRQRYRLGFQLDELVREYGVLRGQIYDLIQEHGLELTLADMRGLSDFIANGIAEGVRQFMEDREADFRKQVALERERFEQLFIHAPAAMALLRGPDFVFEFANAAYQKLVGVHRPLLGMPVRDALPETPSQGFIESLNRVYRTGEPLAERGSQMWLLEEGGKSREAVLNFLYQPFKDREGKIEGVLVHAVEVTEEVRARRAEQVARSEAERDAVELVAVLQAIPDAVYVGDLTGVKYANRSALEMLGYPTLEALNRNIQTLWSELNIRDAVSGKPVPVHEVTYSRALKGETSATEVVVRHRQLGTDVTVYSSGAPVWLGGRIIGAVVINTDVSDRKRLDLERHKREQFEQQLIGIVSHDLRNPLSAILLQTSTLQRNEALDERTRKGLLRIHSTVNRALRLIADLLDFTQARLGGGLPVKPTPIDFDEQIKHAVEDLQLSHRDRTIVLEQHASGIGEWDADRLTQIVSNLLGNALQYSRPDTPVTVRTRGEGDEVALEVHNLGASISREMIPALFEPMKRGMDQLSAPRSVGLGLYIVDQIVRAHRGRISVESTAEQGTTFTVRLPRHFVRS